ncbi:MAG: hypothetical protein U5P41_11330 [Gammaproteobacteria bacterium]|nr:hypothetical protein [Gammaproteobacteria bacterium]
MPVAELQLRLQSCYEIDLPYRVEDFLTTDEALARLLNGDHPHQPHERLLLQQAGDDLSMSLYLDAGLLDRLSDVEALHTAGRDQMADLSLVLEGVSHFVYMAWNASHERPVSLLELELQAEVDKFVTLLLLQGEQGVKTFAELHQWLFEDVSFADTLDEEQLQRYMTANHFAARYCWQLGRRYQQLKGGQDWYNELRRFYRLQHDAKLRRISTLQ